MTEDIITQDSHLIFSTAAQAANVFEPYVSVTFHDCLAVLKVSVH
jgi:hypothetical protein